jgi:hypothetical protein
MTKIQLTEFCRHVYKRQEDYGPQDAFQFLRYHNGKELVMAEYASQIVGTQATATAFRATKERPSGKTIRGNNRRGKQSKGQMVVIEGETDAQVFQTVVAGSSTSGDAATFDNIDPVLLNLHEEGNQLGTTTIAQIDSSAPGTPIQHPAAASGTAADWNRLRPPVTTPNIIITEDQMQTLRDGGYSAGLPINGPNDGPPLYQVPATAEAMISGTVGNDNIENPPTGSESRAQSKPHKRRVRNANRQTIEEATKLGHRSMGTRSNPRTRRR